MDRRARTNLVLVAVLAVVACVIVYGPEPERETPGVPLFDSGEEISHIAVFEDDKARFALERDNGTWRLVAPVGLPAAMFQVDALLAALYEPASQRYSLDKADPAALELDDPQWRVEVNETELLIGGRTAIGNRRYVQMGEFVYLVNNLLSYRLQRDPFDYASKQVLPDALEIRAIELPSGRRIETVGDGWTIVPGSGELSADALQSTVSAWRNARALRVAAADSVPRDGQVRVEFSNGEVLRFGVEIRDDELLLSRADPAVTYYLPVTAAKDLLQIPTSRPSNEPVIE